jgi:general secretion pathway protein G
MIPRTALVILGLLMAAIAAGVMVASIRLNATVDGVNHWRVVGDIKAMNEPLKLYHTLNGSFPTTEQGLRALVEEAASSPRPTHWRRLFEGVPKDPWDTDYMYRCPGVRHPDEYDLFSAGPDRKADTRDDVWEDWGK